MDRLLFWNAADKTLWDILRDKKEGMKSDIAGTPAERMNGATDEELIEHFASRYGVEPLRMLVEEVVGEHHETSVDVSHDNFRRFIRDPSRPVMVAGESITIHVPFTGDPDLFRYKPSTHSLDGPRGRVHKGGAQGGTVSMSLSLPCDALGDDQFDQWIKAQLDSLKRYETWVGDDAKRFNIELRQCARQAVEDRRRRLEKQGELLRKISIPIRPRDDAPSPTPIAMPKKVVKPLPRARPVEQEYGISNDDYEYILKIIRQESRSFESMPATFAGLGEEALRDVVLAHLNGHFKGAASGERFRKHGKTDICIEHENRAAFVAECKLWKGQKALHEAVGQLLGYLTWRDTRAALILWNKTVKDFAKLQADLASHLESHPKFVRRMESGHAGEWRVVMRSDTDEGREVVIHVFLVDLSPGEST